AGQPLEAFGHVRIRRDQVRRAVLGIADAVCLRDQMAAREPTAERKGERRQTVPCENDDLDERLGVFERAPEGDETVAGAAKFRLYRRNRAGPVYDGHAHSGTGQRPQETISAGRADDLRRVPVPPGKSRGTVALRRLLQVAVVDGFEVLGIESLGCEHEPVAM